MKLPDGPQTPALLQLSQWIPRPLELLETSAQRYGDTFTLRLGRIEPMVFLSSPQAIQEIFTAAPEQFEVGRGNDILRPLLGEQSLIMLDGNRHQRQRRLLIPQFEMKLVIATVLSRFEMAIAQRSRYPNADKRPVRPVRRGVTLAPSVGNWLVATGQRQNVNIPVLL